MSQKRPSSVRSGLLCKNIPPACASAVLLVGCAPGLSGEASGPGTQVTLSHIWGNDLKLVTEGEGEPARMLGTLTNTGLVPVEVTVRDADDAASFTIGADDTFRFADNPTIFTTVDVQAGRQAVMTISSTAGKKSVPVPVYQGPIGGYGDRFPNAH